MNKATLSIAILAIFYSIGVIGILLPIHPNFILLTPGNLLLSLSLVIWNHPQWDSKLAILLLLCFLTGYAAEVIGVQTGLIFGNYEYGPVLGWKLWDTPLMIGVNWALLVYCCGCFVNQFLHTIATGWKSIVGAGILVLLDYFIEPVAIKYDFWNWAGNQIPLQNYIGWFLVALLLLYIFFRLQDGLRNNVAVWLLVLQFLFFIILGIF